MPDINARILASSVVLAVLLGGCSMDLGNFSTLSNPFKSEDALNSSDYNYFYRRGANTNSGFVSPNDLVGPDGRCAFDATPAAAPDPAASPESPPPPAVAPQAAQPMNPRSNQALYFTAGPETGRTSAAAQAAMPPEVRTGGAGVALGMTECQVVRLAGYTDRVEVGNEAGQRAVTLTYMSGDRPGIYHFRGGRLITMDRVEVAPPAPKRPQHAKAKPKPKAKKTPPAQ